MDGKGDIMQYQSGLAKINCYHQMENSSKTDLKKKASPKQNKK